MKIKLFFVSIALATAWLSPLALAQEARGGEADQRAANEQESRLAGLLRGEVTFVAEARAARGASIPVIVVLRETALAAPNPLLPTRAELGERRQAISVVRDRVLETTAERTGVAFQRHFQDRRLGDNAQGVYAQFSILPAFAMMADLDTLAVLRGLPEVEAIHEDIPSRPLLDGTPALLGADDMWDLGFDGAGVSIAILDTGVEAEHPMTEPAIIASACFSSNVPGTATSLCPDGSEEMISLTDGEAGDSCVEDEIAVAPDEGTDGCFHGTHVASIAAGRTIYWSADDTLNGIARGANIVSVNVFSRFEPESCVPDGDPIPDAPCVLTYGSDQLSALEWLYTNRDTLGLGAINMSLGGGEYTEACDGDDRRPVIASLRAAGIVTVIATGNDRYTDAISAPSCISAAVAVGSTTDGDEISSFSNSSGLVDLLAPGDLVRGAWQSEEPPEGEDCHVEGSEPNAEGFCHWFTRASGTSMAAPHVAGAFALLRDAFPQATVSEMEAALNFSGRQVTDSENGITRSRIQIEAAHDILADGGVVAAGIALTPIEPYRVSGEAGEPSSFATKTYTLRNTSGVSRPVEVALAPDWLMVTGLPATLPAGGEASFDLGIDTSAQLPASAMASSIQLAAGSGAGVEFITIPLAIQVERSAALAELGPFDWTGDASASTASIFRITGLSEGPPTAIRVAIDNAAASGFAGTFADCNLAIRPGRYSGAEYLVTASDLADCGAFLRADITFQIEAGGADIASGIRMRRFAINSSGGVTDFGFDSEGVNVSAAAMLVEPGVAESSLERLDAESVWGSTAIDAAPTARADDAAATAQIEFGPFEWTGDASAFTGSAFRITGLDTAIPAAIDVAIANASASGYTGQYTDCSLTVSAGRYRGNEYVIAPVDLAACGSFVRADLSFRITADTADAGALTMRRFATAASGGLTDFAFDLENSTPKELSAISATIGQRLFGPFEWTGDANASTGNVFRIVGLNGLPTQIDVAIESALSGQYAGHVSDCALTIRPNRHRGSEYLIVQSDLADCGNFGRGDLTFRIRANLVDVPNGLRMRRFAVGAAGDLTDFGFDHTPGSNARVVALPDGASPGTGAVEFGPFEWTGDANASTLSVFRISGLANGMPERIDVALDNATQGNFQGSYEDCSMRIRSNRAGVAEFVVGGQDLADCGTFSRADVSFRVVVDQADVDAGELTMRRFAITTSGGLTDFGFDADAGN